MRVLIISAEPRLTDLVKTHVGAENQFSVVTQWGIGQATLFKERFDLVCMDYECLKDENLEAFITIDNILTNENTFGCLMVRKSTPATQELHGSLRSLSETIDMSLGKEQFSQRIEHISALAAENAVTRSGEDQSIESNHILQLEVQLPQLAQGKLSNVSITRLLYTCHVRKPSGFLRIHAGGRTAEIAFDEGFVKIAPGYASVAEVIGIFAWAGGDYAFTEASAPAGTREPTLALIERGLSRIPHQQLMNEMNSWMERFPVPTNHWEERQDGLDQFTALHALMRVVDGRSSWSRVLSKMGSLAQEAFKAAYFAVNTDIIYSHDSSSIRGALLTYARDIRLAREKVDEVARQQTKAFRASSEDRTTLENELEDALMGMRAQSKYRIFGVWEGCGRAVVQERFYTLVKEYHPDVYGGNVTGRVKQLAQEIFILVKVTYSELLKAEKGDQTVAPPASAAPPVRVSKTGTARVLTNVNTPIISPETSSAPVGFEPSRNFAERIPTSTVSAVDPGPKADVQSRIERLSGFRQKQEQRSRRRNSAHGLSIDSEADLSEASDAYESPEPVQVEPEVDVEAERRAKLKVLMKKASAVNHPNAPNPAKEAFNTGYRLFKEDKFQQAFVDIKLAYELAPEEPLYQTFYAYLLFKLQPDKHEVAEEILREVLLSGHRQAIPDAYLFMGHIWKARNDTDKAVKHYERALKLNPGCVEAERELRFVAMRDKRNTSEPGSFIKNLFKK